MKPLIDFLLQHLPSATGFTGRLRIKPLKGDGSDRQVYRLFAGDHLSFVFPTPTVAGEFLLKMTPFCLYR